MKISPVISALRDRANIRFVHTGQHYDYELSEAIIEELGLPAADINLRVGSSSHSEQTARTMLALEQDLLAHRPDAIVVAGDVNSTLAAALTAAQQQIPIAHIEAGLRSNDWSMPEELNRVVTDRLSYWLFTPSGDADVNLLNEGIDERRIHLVGNTMVDSLFSQLPKARPRAAAALQRLNVGSDFGLVTIHRASNVDEGERLGSLLEALASLAEILQLVMPLHPRTANALRKHNLTLPRNLISCKPFTYLEFIGLQERASLVLTDSGGVQEETTALGVPCLTLRSTTERPVTCSLGTNKLLGLDVSKILPSAIEALTATRRRAAIPLWDGNSSERIASVLLSELS